MYRKLDFALEYKEPWSDVQFLAFPFLLAFLLLTFFYPIWYLIPVYFAIFVVAFWISRQILIEIKWRKCFAEIPTVPGWNYKSGHTHLESIQTILTQLIENREALGPITICRRPLGFCPLVRLSTAEAFKSIMTTHNPPKSFAMKFLRVGLSWRDPTGSGWLGNSLLTTSGEFWKSRRSLLTPSFHFKVLQNYANVFFSRARIFCDRCQKVGKNGTESFDIFPMITAMTLDAIGACAFGVDLGCQSEDEMNPYAAAIQELTTTIFKRQFKIYYLLDSLFKFTELGRKFQKLVDDAHALPDRLIRERRAYLLEHPEAIENKEHYDFLDLLLSAVDDNGVGLDDRAIRSEANTFLFAGHDTTASGLTWTLYLLATHPEYQKKVQDEIDTTLGDRTEPTFDEAKNGFDFLNLVLKESMRIYPPVPGIVRMLDEPITINGHELPSGTDVLLSIWLIHRAPEYWKDPTTFRPERFVTDEIKPFTYAPFSGGYRNCIGQAFAQLEEKIVIIAVLKRFTLVFDENQEPVIPENHIIMRPKNPLKLFFKARQ